MVRWEETVYAGTAVDEIINDVDIKMLNILLDLDNTLISSVTLKEDKSLKKSSSMYTTAKEKLNWKLMGDDYIVFERPGLQEFLTYLFQHFNVSVWTAATKSYALFIIDEFILKHHPERKLNFILFSHHCRISMDVKNTQKSLEMIPNHFGLDVYAANTFIIDDNPDVYEAQKDKCIPIKAFEIGDGGESAMNDRELVKMKEYLAALDRRYSR